jgi:phage terminase small subunit
MARYRQDRVKAYATARAKGMAVTQAADAAGIGRTSAYRWETAEDVKQSIDELARVYVSKLPKAIKLSHDLIDAADAAEKTPENAKILELGAREAQTIRKTVSIEPSHTVSVVIGNLVLGDQTNVLAPNVQGLLDRQLGEILDVTPNPLGAEDTDGN